MVSTQQVIEFDTKDWCKRLVVAIQKFFRKASECQTDYSDCSNEFKSLFNEVPSHARAQPGVPEILNRLASLAQADPNLFNPQRTPHAYKMQDVALNRCTAIMQLIKNRDRLK